jgi:hypothetical protein
MNKGIKIIKRAERDGLLQKRAVEGPASASLKADSSPDAFKTITAWIAEFRLTKSAEMIAARTLQGLAVESRLSGR